MPGYDGGLPQKFVLEVYHGDVDFLTSSQPLYNVSNPDEPTFALAGLEASVEAGVHVAVYAVNAKGRSQPVTLSEVTYRDAEKRTGEYGSDVDTYPCLGCGCVFPRVFVKLVEFRLRSQRRASLCRIDRHFSSSAEDDDPACVPSKRNGRFPFSQKKRHFF